MSTRNAGRRWIKVGPDPLRFEYGRENPDPSGPPITHQLAYVEQERSGHFTWETYTDPHQKGSEPDRMKAQKRAIDALDEMGVLESDR